MDATLAQIILFAGNFAPRGWALCEGQLLPISQNQALFSLLGTIYGGDGRTTFALPDLRGRVPLHKGDGPGLSDRRQGSKGGSETETLNITQIPSHTHVVANKASTDEATLTTPSGNVIGTEEHFAAPGNLVDMAGPTATGNTGGSQSHPNMQPTLGLNYIIALQGVFPSRS